MHLDGRAARALTLITIALFLASIAPVSQTAAQEKYPREVTFIYAAGSSLVPDNFNAFVSTGFIGNRKIIRPFLQEFFFEWDLVSGKLIPWLATGFEYSHDYKSIRIFLRRGVNWNDGVPFTADDVVFTVKYLKKHPELVTASWVNTNIEDAIALDKYTVLLKLKKPNPRFHLGLISVIGFPEFWVMPKHVYEKVEDPMKFKNWPDPVFTGPYKVVKCTKEMVVLERRDDYWGIKYGWIPQPKYVIGKCFKEAEKLYMALDKAEVDTSGLRLGMALKLAEKNPYIKLWIFRMGDVDLLDVNIHKYPLSLREVRWAISYAIDRAKLAKAVNPLGEPAKSWFPPDTKCAREFVFSDVLAKYDWITTFDPDKAIKILEDLGFKRGADGIFVTPNGTRLSFKMIYPSPEWVPGYAEFMVTSLKKIGIEVIPEPMAFSEFFSKLMKLDYDLAYSWSQSAARVSPYRWYSRFHSKLIKPKGVEVSELENTIRYSNPEVDKLLDELSLMLDDTPRAKEIYHRLFEIFVYDLPRIPIICTPEARVFNTKYWTNYPISPPNPGAWGGNPVNWDSKLKFVTFSIKPTMAPVWKPPEKIPEKAEEKISELAKGISDLKAKFEELKGISDKVSSLSSEVSSLSDKVSSLSGTLEELKIEKVAAQVRAIAGLPSLVYASLAVSIIAIIISIVAVAFAKKR